MAQQFYTFRDIIILNDHDWDKAYFILQFYQEKGILKKEIRGPEDIIYHVLDPLHDSELVYDFKFRVPDSDSLPMREKRKRLWHLGIPEKYPV